MLIALMLEATYRVISIRQYFFVAMYVKKGPVGLVKSVLKAANSRLRVLNYFRGKRYRGCFVQLDKRNVQVVY